MNSNYNNAFHKKTTSLFNGLYQLADGIVYEKIIAFDVERGVEMTVALFSKY